MKILYWLLSLILTITVSLVSAYAEPEVNNGNVTMSSYQLAAGDTINISIYREPDLSLQSKLTDAGTIIYPFLGEISVSGLTIGQVKEKIITGLNGRFLIDPQVTVSISAYREFFVNGEVNKPGAYPYLPGLNVQKAISIAGGFSERASQSEVVLIHERDGKKVEVGLEAPIQPGDVIMVDESFF